MSAEIAALEPEREAEVGSVALVPLPRRVVSVRSPVWNIGPVDRIPRGEGRVCRIGQFVVAVFHTRSGEVYATQALCPHRGGPLADGIVGGGQVVCPLHSYKFDLATGAPVGGRCAALQTYPVSLSRAGDILLTLDR